MTHLEDKPADWAPGDAGPAVAADDVTLRALVHGGPGQLEADGTLQLTLQVETLVHGGGPGERPGPLLSLTCLPPLLLLLLHLGYE